MSLPVSTLDGASSLWRTFNWGELLWITLEGGRTALGASMKPDAPAARVEAGEPLLPPAEDEPAEESPEGTL